ncbi:YhfG family protein [Rouxiella chamberiensis]|uniref:YhfG family protein n=1 Tax=Rouxiella chamberiensis TaxID=1513468 RepID=A0ABY7HP60_9GAMM|nr:YhfG family protein [Rouxiella chamberiensis]WAT00827.1 YhfG family protein [Rouxiella chamberiensis]
MATKLTDKQKEQFYRKRRNLNFQGSTALDGLTLELIDLTDEQIAARLEEVRGKYER